MQNKIKTLLFFILFSTSFAAIDISKIKPILKELVVSRCQELLKRDDALQFVSEQKKYLIQLVSNFKAEKLFESFLHFVVLLQFFSRLEKVVKRGQSLSNEQMLQIFEDVYPLVFVCKKITQTEQLSSLLQRWEENFNISMLVDCFGYDFVNNVECVKLI